MSSTRDLAFCHLYMKAYQSQKVKRAGTTKKNLFFHVPVSRFHSMLTCIQSYADINLKETNIIYKKIDIQSYLRRLFVCASFFCFQSDKASPVMEKAGSCYKTDWPIALLPSLCITYSTWNLSCKLKNCCRQVYEPVCELLLWQLKRSYVH